MGVPWSERGANACREISPQYEKLHIVFGDKSGTVVSTGMQNFLMADGVLTWIETAGATRALKASSASGNQTLSIQTTSLLYDAAGGYVLYGEQGKAYSWKASSGASALLLDVAPNQLIINGSVVYIVIGNAKAVYKVVLN